MSKQRKTGRTREEISPDRDGPRDRGVEFLPTAGNLPPTPVSQPLPVDDSLSGRRGGFWRVGPDGRVEPRESSNQLLQEQLRDEGAEADPPGAPDAFLPVVERAMLSLQLYPRPAADQARFLEVIQRSRLPEARKGHLVERIEGDQAAALGVREALEAWFGADTPELRATLDEVLDAVWASLGSRPPAVDGGPRPLDGIGELVRDLAGGRLDAHVGDHGAAGDAVAGFCRQIASLWLWGGEEEEEDDPVVYPAEG